MDDQTTAVLPCKFCGRDAPPGQEFHARCEPPLLRAVKAVVLKDHETRRCWHFPWHNWRHQRAPQGTEQGNSMARMCRPVDRRALVAPT